MSEILNLVRKDFILQRRYIWIIALYVIGFSGLFMNSNLNILYGMLPGMMLILVVSSDMRQANQQFLVTLPVKRSRLVLSKYVTSILFVMLALATCSIVSMGMSLYHSHSASIDYAMLLASLVSVLVLMSIYLPLYYWLGIHGGQYLNIAMMVLVMLGNGAVTDIAFEYDFTNIITWLNSHPVGSIALGVCSLLLIIVISYLISVRIFKSRDL